MSRSRSALAQAAIYGASIALMKGMSLVMLPFVAAHLTQAEFGRLEVIASLAIVFSVLVGLGLSDSLYRYAGQAANESGRRREAARIHTLACVMAAIAGVAGWFAAPTIAATLPGDPGLREVRLVLAGLAFEGCISVPLAWLRMTDRPVAFVTATTGRALLQAALTVLALKLDRGLAGVLEASLVSTCLQALLLTRWQVRDTGHAFDPAAWRALTVYSLPIMGSGVLAFGLNGLDRWLLADMAGVEAVATYGIAAKFALATVLLMQPFGMWWAPRRFAVLNGEGGAAAVARMVSLGLVLLMLVTLSVALAAPVLVDLLMPKHYAVAAGYAVGLVLVMMLREAVELLNIGCFAGPRTHIQFHINAVATVVGLGLMFLLVPRYGVHGTIAALGVAQALRLVAFTVASQRAVPLPLPVRRLAMVAAVAAAWLVLAVGTADPLMAALCLAGAVLTTSAAALAGGVVSLPGRASVSRSANSGLA